MMIDALDEAHKSDSGDLVFLLQDLISFSPEKPPVKICLSCRMYPLIQIDNCFEIQVDRFNGSSIQRYIERWFKPSKASPEIGQ